MNKSRKSNLGIGLALFNLLLLLAVVVFLVNRSGDDQQPPVDNGSPIVSDADLSAALLLAHTGTGHLENQELKEAASIFEQLIEKLPNEPLGYRNLAVGQYIAFDEDKLDRAELQTAIERLRKAEPEAAPSWWLEGKATVKEASTTYTADARAAKIEQAIAAFQQAVELDPTNPAYYYELFEAARTSTDSKLKEIGERALDNAYRLEPANLFLLSDWLLVNAQTENGDIVPALKQAKKTILSMRERIQKKTGVDIVELADLAMQAANEENWGSAKLNVRKLWNVTRPEDFSQSDKRRLLQHPLEFALHRFSESLESRITSGRGTEPIPTEVTLAHFTKFDNVAGTELVALRCEDFDLDGQLDLIALHDQRVVIYKAASGAWQEIANFDLPAGSRGLLVADLDHDLDKTLYSDDENSACFEADVDLVVYGESGLVVVRNDLEPEAKRRTLAPVEQPALTGLTDIRTGILIDYDHDSDLDLVLSTGSGVKALLSEGQMAFVDATRYSQMPEASSVFTAMAMVDWDRDVDIDIVLSSPDGQTAGYLENLRHGNFRWIEFPEAYADLCAARDLAVFESDGNRSWDLVGSGSTGTHVVQTATVPAGAVKVLRTRVLSEAPVDDLLVADLDYNGAQDVLTWGDGGIQLQLGQPDGAFSTMDTTALFESPPGSVSACDVGDIDQDGDLDLVAAVDGQVGWCENRGVGDNFWLTVRALGQIDNKGKANHNGIGSLVELKTGVHYQARIVDRPVIHFGLGETDHADALRFLWTNGVPQAKVRPAANQSICEEMILKGSCPYLYAWNGERFDFVTDLLWAAPLGLQLAEGSLAPDRPWEYLLVTAEQLRPLNGAFEIVITEELWEAAYFDKVQLLAIDHPADVSVCSNEKVGPAEIAEFTVHTMRQPRTPVSARDKHGRDVLDKVRDADQDFFRGFDRKQLPGRVDPHFLELDFGELQDPQTIKLFLTGWIFPTDTSHNIFISQDPDVAAPRPPSIWVPNAAGQWQEVVGYMGFPGGKTKTIAVDVSDVFLCDDYRLRIQTSAEIYWDQVFFTVDESPSEVRIQPLPLRSALLKFRGVSAARPPKPNAPETYDFDRVLPTSKWPPMLGSFTRYGGVHDLLTDTDDQMVVMAAGDAMHLAFGPPPDDLPDGWRRDFILHNVGWDKDADLNTVYGQTVEPLPFVDMERYPYVEQAYPQTPAHGAYLQQYQTRRMPVKKFWRFGE
jgi:tetratricopeptide (TPR) repeat protein